MILGLVIIGIYGQMDSSQESVQSRQGVLFFLSVNQLMLSVMNIVMTFPEERAAFVREQRAGMYSCLSYYLSKVLVELPFQIIFPMAMAGAGLSGSVLLGPLPVLLLALQLGRMTRQG